MVDVALEQGPEGYEDVAVLRMAAGENRFSPDWLSAVEDAVGQVEADDGPGALVLVGAGKFFSNGLDLEYLGTQGPEAWGPYVERVHHLFARVLGLGVPTAAALNGHTFAAGAMLSLACDLRVMRADRGFWCLPEVDIDIPFAPPMNALITTKLPAPLAHEVMVFGPRVGGEDAAARGLVHEAVAEDEVLPRACRLVQERSGRKRSTMRAIKRRLHAEALGLLEEEGQRLGAPTG